MDDRRKAERYQKEIPVTFSNGENKYKGVAACLSETGIFIITNPPFKPGTPIRMTLEISHHENIYLAGVVIRTITTGDANIKDGMGVKLNETPFVYYNFIKKIRSY